MRWSWLRTAILGLLLGPAPVTADVPDGVDPSEADQYELEKAGGHTVHGAHFYVWEEDAREAMGWALDLREASVAGDPSTRWQEVAARAATAPTVLTRAEEIELQEGMQTGHEGPTLGMLLCLLPSLDRTCLISAWATSPRESTRRALADALSRPFEAVGVRTALELLRGDPSPEVRRLARVAAASRANSRLSEKALM